MNTLNSFSEMNYALAQHGCVIKKSTDTLGDLFSIYHQENFIGAFFWNSAIDSWISHPAKGTQIPCICENQALAHILMLRENLLPCPSYEDIEGLTRNVKDLTVFKRQLVDSYNAFLSYATWDYTKTDEANEKRRDDNLSGLLIEIKKCDELYKAWLFSSDFRTALTTSSGQDDLN